MEPDEHHTLVNCDICVVMGSMCLLSRTGQIEQGGNKSLLPVSSFLFALIAPPKVAF